MVVGGAIIIPSVAIGIPWHVGYALHSSPRNHEHRGQALLQPASRTAPSVKIVRIINRFMGAISKLAAISWTSRQPSKHEFQRDPVPPQCNRQYVHSLDGSDACLFVGQTTLQHSP